MNNVVAKYAKNNALEEFEQMFFQNGKYICLALAIGAVYNLCSQAISHGCNFEFKTNKEGVVFKVENRQEQ